ncbi:MAG: hypothetical protein ACRDFS_08825 [Chloroflexota bacterium]
MMRRLGLTLLICLTILFSFDLHRQDSADAAGRVEKAKCHTVTKKVHGKKKHVKVCASSKKKHTGKHKATNYDQLAAKLAAAIDGAASDDARIAGIDKALAALRIPVLNAHGHDVVKVSAKTNFFLPESWVQSLDQGFAQKQTLSYDTLAQLEAAANLQISGAAPTGATERNAIATALAAAAAKPTSPHNLADLIVLQLGLHRSPAVDLRSVSDTSSLDPLQFVILLIEGLSPAAGPPTAHGVFHSPIHSLGLRSHQSSLPKCPAIGDVVPGEFWDQNVTIATDTEVRVDMWAVVGLGISYFYNLDITGDMPDGADTHDGPAGHAANAGKSLTFRVQVENRAHASLPCLNPPFVAPTGNSGLDINWNHADLDKYGAVVPALVTDDSGQAVMSFQPKDEAFPGFGSLVTRDVTVTATPGFDFKITDPVLRGELSAMFATQPLSFTAHVSFHQARGFMFSGAKVHYWVDILGARSDTYRTYSGHVCGSDPYATPWAMHADQTTINSGGTFNDPQDFPVDFKTEINNPGVGDWFQIIPGANPQMVVSWGAVAPIQPPTATQTVPITEDTSCPDPGS